MKRIIYIIISVLSSCGFAYGQSDITRTKPVGSDPTNSATYNKQTVVDNNLRAKLTLYIPTGSTATLNNSKDSTGAVYYAQSDSSFNVRQNGVWVKFRSYYTALNELKNYVPYTGSFHDLDLVSTGKGVYASFESTGHGVTDGAGNSAALFYNEAPTGVGVQIQAGDATHEGMYIQDYTMGQKTVRLFGDGHAIFNGTMTLGTIPSGTGSDSVLTSSGGLIKKVSQASISPSVSGTITSSPTVGQTFASLNGFVALFSQTNNPTGGLSGGNNYQRSASNVTHNLSYSYGRTNLNTNPIASAVINPGSFNVFSSSPSQGATNSGTQSVTTSANVNTTYSIHIVTTDGKSADYYTADNWYGNAYYGRAAGTAATSGEVLASAGGGSPLAGSHAGTWAVTASGSNYPFIAIPATLGHITQFLDVNGLNVTTSFPETTVSITNGSSYTESYYVYTFVTATSSNYFFQTN